MTPKEREAALLRAWAEGQKNHDRGHHAMMADLCRRLAAIVAKS
jgi:hypothetical protein